MLMLARSSEDGTSEKINLGYGLYFVMMKCLITMHIPSPNNRLTKKKGLVLSTCVLIQVQCDMETLTYHFTRFVFIVQILLSFVRFYLMDLMVIVNVLLCIFEFSILQTRETHKGEGGYPLGASGSVMVGSGGAKEEDEENWD